MTAVMMWAAGSGTRLRQSDDPVLASTPKLLVPVYTDRGALPLVEYQLDGLSSAGFSDFVMLTREGSDTGYQQIETIARRLLSDRASVNVFRETQPRLGTGGILRKGCDVTQQSTVLVVTGDMLIPFAHLPQAVTLHTATNSRITSVVTTNPEPNAYNAGRILIDVESNRVVADPFDGTSTTSSSQFAATSAGAMIIDVEWFRDAFDLYQGENGAEPEVDFHRQFLSWLLTKEEPSRFYDLGEPAPDLGEPDRYFAHCYVGNSARTPKGELVTLPPRDIGALHLSLSDGFTSSHES